jgi:hypothetical protein
MEEATPLNERLLFLELDSKKYTESNSRQQGEGRIICAVPKFLWAVIERGRGVSHCAGCH